MCELNNNIDESCEKMRCIKNYSWYKFYLFVFGVLICYICHKPKEGCMNINNNLYQENNYNRDLLNPEYEQPIIDEKIEDKDEVSTNNSNNVDEKKVEQRSWDFRNHSCKGIGIIPSFFPTETLEGIYNKYENEVSEDDSNGFDEGMGIVPSFFPTAENIMAIIKENS